MSVKKQYEKLVKSDIFKKWKKDSKDNFFAHAFAILDAENNGEWQFGFYNPKTDLMTSFFIGDEITHSPETEIMKHDEMKIKELNINKVKIDFEEALATAEKCQQENFPGEKPIKKVMILQNINSEMLWNISYLTASFNLLNIRVDALTNKIVEQKKASMMDFARVDNGEEEEDEVQEADEGQESSKKKADDKDTNYIL